jgi:hypothetical protein
VWRRLRGGAADADADTTEAGSTLFADGTAHTVSMSWDEGDYAAMVAAVVPVSDGLSGEELSQQTETLRTFILERTEALEGEVQQLQG